MKIIKQTEHCKLIELIVEELMEFTGLVGFKPELVEEKEMSGFKALNGKYKAVVKNFERYKNEGVSESGYEWKIDKIQIDFQITETVSGDKGDNRFVRKEFDIAREEWREDTIKRFLSMVYTITREDVDFKYEEGDDFETVVGKAVVAADPIMGKVCNITVYPAKEKKDWKGKDGKEHKKGDIKINYKGDEEMSVLVVAEHKTKGDKKSVSKPAVIENF